MPDEHLQKKFLSWELQVGKHSHGGQNKRYKDTLKAYFNPCSAEDGYILPLQTV